MAFGRIRLWTFWVVFEQVVWRRRPRTRNTALRGILAAARRARDFLAGGRHRDSRCLRPLLCARGRGTRHRAALLAPTTLPRCRRTAPASTTPRSYSASGYQHTHTTGICLRCMHSIIGVTHSVFRIASACAVPAVYRAAALLRMLHTPPVTPRVPPPHGTHDDILPCYGVTPRICLPAGWFETTRYWTALLNILPTPRTAPHTRLHACLLGLQTFGNSTRRMANYRWLALDGDLVWRDRAHCIPALVSMLIGLFAFIGTVTRRRACVLFAVTRAVPDASDACGRLLRRNAHAPRTFAGLRLHYILRFGVTSCRLASTGRTLPYGCISAIFYLSTRAVATTTITRTLRFYSAYPLCL